MTSLDLVQLATRYRSLQILQSRANRTFRYPLAAVKLLLLLLMIRFIYGMVKMDGPLRLLNLNNTIGNLVFLLVTFRALGQIYEKSGYMLLKHRRLIRGNKWFRRFLWSCWPLRFEIANLYFVDPPMSLTMGSFILENVANMLMLGA